MTALTPIIRPQLGKLIPMLSSDRDGEVVAAARAIGRLLRGAGHDWHDLAAAVAPSLVPAAPYDDFEYADWRELVYFCAERIDQLSKRELDFIDTLARYRNSPSAKQLEWLRHIAARLREAAA